MSKGYDRQLEKDPDNDPSRSFGAPIAWGLLFCLVAFVIGIVRQAFAEPIDRAKTHSLRIVSWNAKPTLYEGMGKRLKTFRRMADELKPDVIVFIEVAGKVEAKMIADALGWKDYSAVVSNWAKLGSQVHFALEAMVISKIPIIKATEYDPKPDGFIEAFSSKGNIEGIVNEETFSSDGIAHFGEPLARTDRGTLRVDLANGLTIFPLHLKSNRNGACINLQRAVRAFKKAGLPVPKQAQSFLKNGFAQATKINLRNARKRERVMAATVRLAGRAIDEGRTVIIAGDMNTGFEPGKYGKSPDDCNLKHFSCEKAPFPLSACTDGDGFDDTLGILQEGLVGKVKWSVLSRKLGRTYDDKRFGDYAIDHMAVPIDKAKYFTSAKRADEAYGSDHYPIITDFTNGK